MTVGVASAADNYGTEYGPHTSMLCLKSSQEDESSTAVVVNWTATIGLVQDVARRFKTLQISTQALARDTDGALKARQQTPQPLKRAPEMPEPRRVLPISERIWRNGRSSS